MSDITQRIKDCAERAFAEMGRGHTEVIYQNHLIHQFLDNGIPINREFIISIANRNGTQLGYCKVDLVIDGVVVELKAVQSIGEREKMQLDKYLRHHPFVSGILINFGPTCVTYHLQSPQMFLKTLACGGNHPPNPTADAALTVKEFAQRAFLEMGPGHSDVIYQNHLIHQLAEGGFPFQRDVVFPITNLLGTFLGTCKADLTVGRVIVVLKTVQSISEKDKAQMNKYRRQVPFTSFLLVNFGLSSVTFYEQ